MSAAGLLLAALACWGMGRPWIPGSGKEGAGGHAHAWLAGVALWSVLGHLVLALGVEALRPLATIFWGAGLALAAIWIARARARARATRRDLCARSSGDLAGRIFPALVLVLGAVLIWGALGRPLSPVDALEVYQLKTKMLWEGRLLEDLQLHFGSSHPLLLPLQAFLGATLVGAVRAEALTFFSAGCLMVLALDARALFAARLRPAVAWGCAAVVLFFPPLVEEAMFGKADVPLMAFLLAAHVRWARAQLFPAALFFGAAAACKNEGLAWVVISLVARLAAEPSSRAALRSALAVGAWTLFLLVPELCLRARLGLRAEHLNEMDLGLLLDPVFALHRAGIILGTLWRSCLDSAGWHLPLVFAVALLAGFLRRASAARFAVLMVAMWYAVVFGVLLLGRFDASWQSAVAAGRIHLQALVWIVLAAALCLGGEQSESRGCARSPGRKKEDRSRP